MAISVIWMQVAIGLYEIAHNQLDGWNCGHWQINKVDDPMTFLYEDIREITINNKRGTL